jgi:hypothetical protein
VARARGHVPLARSASAAGGFWIMIGRQLTRFCPDCAIGGKLDCTTRSRDTIWRRLDLASAQRVKTKPLSD